MAVTRSLKFTVVDQFSVHRFCAANWAPATREKCMADTETVRRTLEAESK
jgi:hypothetical protein